MTSTKIFLIHFICYWTMVLLYDKNVPSHTFNKSAMLSLKNQICYTYPIINMLFIYYPISYENFGLSLGCLPVLAATGDIYFYVMHRPLHTKLLFKYHKSHHTGKIHVAKSLDGDCVEHIIGNMGSFLFGILLLQYLGFILNIYIIGVWFGVATINICISHSNHNSKLDDGSHYLHHKTLRCNYGTGLYLMDRIMGTYKIE